MNREELLSLVIVVALPVILLVTCGTPAPTYTPTPMPPTATSTPIPPRFIHHAPPELAVDFDVFENAGCPPDGLGFRHCEADSLLAALGCDRIGKPPDLLGGLEPSHPIALCLIDPGRHGIRRAQMTDYFYWIGCDEPMAVRYVIWRDDQFHLIKTEDELRAIFAPIVTANEALAYAISVKGRHSAYYGLEYRPKEYEYLVDEIEDTHVDTLTNGYLVHLFWYELCGCGHHKTYAVDFHITNQGHIGEVKSEPSHRDLAHKCID